ncbi:MAG: PAS domain S-box protein [Dehalococcoidales bacterium]|nr:MAG: PAS domain S-box protein [Dehalococcoidales bacterium]
MAKKDKPFFNRLGELLRRPGFWSVILLFALFTVPHYSEAYGYPAGLGTIMSAIGLTRHAMERILFLIPIVWSGFLFGTKGTIISSIIALACMLPRALLISEYRADALFETAAITIVGGFVSGLSSFSLRLLNREREYVTELEEAHQELARSEQRYRSLFENAHDAILLQDLNGYILAANEASAKLTGYELNDLVGMNVIQFLPEQSLEMARDIRKKLLEGESIDSVYDQQMTRKDGVGLYLRLSVNLITDKGNPTAFQLIARDVTEEKKMQDNLQFYLQEATEAQEEERKRISRELHDETIQELVVLSQKLDMLSVESKTMSEEDRRRLEKLQQDTGNIMKGIRRLSQDLRPAALDQLGLIPALEWLLADTEEYSGLKTAITVTGEKRRLPERTELVLFRIIQEAIRNTWRHSKASRADIKVGFTSNKVSISVSDDGEGFLPPASMGDLAKDGKLGLAGMHERARLIGGKMGVHSEPGKGTEIVVEIEN